MTMKTLKLVTMCFALTVSLLAADPSGLWKAEFQGPQGNTIHSSIALKANGGSLTGTVEGMRGKPTPISDGKIDGNELTFTVVRHWQGVDIKTYYRGVLKKDVIHFTVTREGGQAAGEEFDAKRGS